MKGYDIIIQGGQSNAEGSGLGEVEKEYIPDDDILYLEAEKSVEAPIEGVRVTYADKPFFVHRAEERLGKDNRILGDFALTFSEKYKQSGLLKVERKILIVRAAVGD